MNKRKIYAFIIGFCDCAFLLYPSLALVLYDISNPIDYFISVVPLIACYGLIRSAFPIPITNEWVENNE